MNTSKNANLHVQLPCKNLLIGITGSIGSVNLEMLSRKDTGKGRRQNTDPTINDDGPFSAKCLINLFYSSLPYHFHIVDGRGGFFRLMVIFNFSRHAIISSSTVSALPYSLLYPLGQKFWSS